MGIPEIGAVVLIRFPFSDLSSVKLRPALVIASAENGDFVLCQITSNPWGDLAALKLSDSDFSSGALPLISYLRPAKLFTANEVLIVRQTGRVKKAFFMLVISAITRIFELSLSQIPED